MSKEWTTFPRTKEPGQATSQENPPVSSLNSSSRDSPPHREPAGSASPPSAHPHWPPGLPCADRHCLCPGGEDRRTWAFSGPWHHLLAHPLTLLIQPAITSHFQGPTSGNRPFAICHCLYLPSHKP